MNGKKTPPEVIYKIMTSWATTDNYKQTSEEIGVPVMTVKRVVEKNKDKPEFQKLRADRVASFIEKATVIIDKGLTLLDRRFDRAIANEEDLDLLLDEIFNTPKTEITPDEKKRLAMKIATLQIQDVKAITTAIGTLYDKKALSEGKATENVAVEVKLPPGVDEYAE